MSVVPADLIKKAPDVTEFVKQFASICDPLEKDALYVLIDARTHARYCECHIRASQLIPNATIDVPLDPEEQAEYRANREIVEDHAAYEKMKEDAAARRTFSNLVAEFTLSFDEEHPLKIIGGQHRFSAIQEALAAGIDEYHGLKIYFDLDADQRLDVQLISTPISRYDPFDRMQETLTGPKLRDWCQAVGFLDAGQDFADKRDRARPVTVRAVRTFITSYYRGRSTKPDKFDQSSTTPSISKTGVQDAEWDAVKADHPDLWVDTKLKAAGMAYAGLIEAQRTAFLSTTGKSKRANIDFGEKALNFAVLSAWAFTAGVLHSNSVRLERHFGVEGPDREGPTKRRSASKRAA